MWDGIWLKLGATALVAFPATIFGINTDLILILMVLFFCDFFTGVIKAFAIKEKVSSRRAFDSIIKGSMYFSFIIASWCMTLIFQEYIPFHVGTISLAIIIEFRSVLENIRDSKVNFPILSNILDFVDVKIEQTVNYFKKQL